MVQSAPWLVPLRIRGMPPLRPVEYAVGVMAFGFAHHWHAVLKFGVFLVSILYSFCVIVILLLRGSADTPTTR